VREGTEPRSQRENESTKEIGFSLSVVHCSSIFFCLRLALGECGHSHRGLAVHELES
jgi:hypothetical protein